MPEEYIERPLRVEVTYEPGPVNPFEDGERIGAALCPLWPYARGEWPLSYATPGS